MAKHGWIHEPGTGYRWFCDEWDERQNGPCRERGYRPSREDALGALGEHLRQNHYQIWRESVDGVLREQQGIAELRARLVTETARHNAERKTLNEKIADRDGRIRGLAEIADRRLRSLRAKTSQVETLVGDLDRQMQNTRLLNDKIVQLEKEREDDRQGNRYIRFRLERKIELAEEIANSLRKRIKELENNTDRVLQEKLVAIREILES